MSQVKKLQAGGSLTIDGIKYEATPEFINSLTTHLRDTAGADAQTLAGLSNALLNGQNLRYDSAANTISGMDGEWSGITNRQNQLRRTGSSNWRKWWEAQFDTDAHRFRNALSAIGSFHYQPTEKKDDTSANLKDISSDKQWFEFTKGEDGKETWNDSVFNSSLFQRIDDVTSWLKDPEAGKKAYRLGSGYTDAYMQAFQNLYKQNEADWDAKIKGIKDRLRAGIQDPNDLAFLKNFFIAKPDATPEETAAAEDAANKKKWTDAGVGGLYDRFGNIAHLNDDGSITLNEGQSWGWNLNDIYSRNPNWNGNIYFNDDFYKKYGADKSWDPLRGYTAYGNTLYNLSNPTLRAILQQENGFNSLKDAGDWDAADDIILTRFTDRARENPGIFRADRYSGFLSDHPEYRFTNLTGLYDIAGLNDGEQLIQLYDLDKPIDNPNSPYREYAPQYMVLDNRGKLVRDYGNFNGTRIRGASAKDLNAYKRVTADMGGNKAYHGRYYEDIVGKNGKDTGYRVYYDPNDSENIILHMPGINANGVDSDQDIKVPTKLGKILAKKFQDEDFLKRLIGNAQNKKDFQMLMSQLVQSWFRQDWNSGFNRSMLHDSINPWWGLFTETNLKKWKDLGFKDQELEEVVNAWKEAKRNRTAGNRDERRDEYLVTAPEIPEEEKNGGVLKNQFGGVAGGSTNVQANTARKVDAKNTNPKNSAGITEIGGKNWTDADTADMFALVADLGSLGLAIAPGMGIAAAGTGAAGSTARLYADLSRGTKSAGLNYLLNLGMDAATIIPGLGAGIKGANIAKNVGKALPTIVKAASVYGLGAGVVETAKKIASGQKFTVRDVDMLVNTLTAGIGLGKSGGFGKKTKKVDITEGISLKSKNGEKTISLSGEELKDVDTPDKLFDKLLAKSKLTKEQFGEQFDTKSLLSEKQTWKPGWKPKDWFRKQTQSTFNPKTSKKPVDFTSEEIADMGAFERWWRGLNTENQLYNSKISGEGVGKAPTKREFLEKTGSRPQRTRQYLLTDTNGRPIFNEGEFKRTGYYEQPFSGPDDSGFMVLPRGIRYMDAATGTMKIRPKEGVRFNRASYRRANAKYNNRLNYYNRLGIALPQWINPFTAANYQRNQDQQPSGFVMPELYTSPALERLMSYDYYKKGGKIKKGQTGLKLNLDILDPNKVKSQGFIPKIDPMYKAPSGSISTFVPNQPKELSPELQNFRVTNPMTGKAVQTSVKTSNIDAGGDSLGKQNPYLGGGISLKEGFDPTMPLNAISAAVQLGNAKRQKDIGLMGGPLQYQTFATNSRRMMSSPEVEKLNELSKSVLIRKDQTSDPLVNLSDSLNRQVVSNNYKLEAAKALSQLFSQNNAQNEEIAAANQERATNMANQNRFNWDNWFQRLKATMLGYETQKSQVLDKLMYAGTQYASDNYHRYRNALAQKDLMTNLKNNNQEFIDLTKGVDMNSAGASEAITGFRNQWQWNNQMAQLEAQTKANLDPYHYNKLYAKSGGKVGKDSKVTYSRDPYPEVLLQNTKDSAQAVKQLNDAIIKLLLQTKPINVH